MPRISIVTPFSALSAPLTNGKRLMILSLIVCISLSTHLTLVAEKVYDPRAYREQLEEISNRYKQDLQDIKGRFTDINLRLKETNVSSSGKVIYLQETLAEERDALYNIQSYLSVPFALRACQCLNLTQAQKDQLSKQISSVSAQIDSLQQASKQDSSGSVYDNPSCKNAKCEVAKSVEIEIKQLRAYVKVMEDTATSDCCKVVHYVFRDNLVNANNWVYGDVTDEQYRSKIFQETKKHNLTQCPTDLPFVNESINQCFGCPDEKPLFNLTTRQCAPSCESENLVFVDDLHKCDINRTCQSGKYFNNITFQCQKDLGSLSTCPRERPIWNDRILSCQPCPAKHPYFDTSLQSCRACTENQAWWAARLECVPKSSLPVQCDESQVYNFELQKCLPESESQTGSQSGNPSGSKDDSKVSSGRPPLTGTQTQTQPGSEQSEKPGETSQSGSGSSSQEPSSADGEPDEGTKIGAGQIPPGGTYSLCPPDAPFWSDEDKSCHECESDKPRYNRVTKKCQACPPDTKYSEISKECEKDYGALCGDNQHYNKQTQKCEPVKICKSNEIFNKATGRCESLSASGQVGLCPPDSPLWSEESLACQKCSKDKPHYNITTNNCEPCPDKTYWDSIQERCLFSGVKCPSGKVLNSQTGKCQQVKCTPQAPILNYQTSRCEPCPDGTTYNAQTYVCESLVEKHGNASACPEDEPYWNAARLSCEACPPGEKKNDKTGQCEAALSHLSAFPFHLTQVTPHEAILEQKVTHLSSVELRPTHLGQLSTKHG